MPKGFEQLRLLNFSGVDVDNLEFVGLSAGNKKVIPATKILPAKLGKNGTKKHKEPKGKAVTKIKVLELRIGAKTLTNWELAVGNRPIESVFITVRPKAADFQAQAHIFLAEGAFDSSNLKDIA